MAIQTTNGALTKPPTAMASHNTSNKLIKMMKKSIQIKSKTFIQQSHFQKCNFIVLK